MITVVVPCYNENNVIDIFLEVMEPILINFIVKTLIYGVDLPGYASLVSMILFLGGIQLMGIGILGEYIGRIYKESKRRPSYIIENEY